MEIIGYLASFLMGVTLGIMGGGGSILTVPIMVYLFGISPTVATGNSLFVVGITAFIGSLMYIRKGDIDFKTGIIFAVPSMIGVNISRGLIIPSIPDVIFNYDALVFTKEVLIMTAFAVLMVSASYSMIKKRIPKESVQVNPTTRMILIGLQGLIIGLIAGFVGAGGGFLIVPALVILAGLKMRIALGTSLMIIAVQSLFGFAGDVSRGAHVDWKLLILVSAVAVVGIIFGSTLAHKIEEQKLKTAFGWFVLFMGTGIFLEQFSHFLL